MVNPGLLAGVVCRNLGVMGQMSEYYRGQEIDAVVDAQVREQRRRLLYGCDEDGDAEYWVTRDRRRLMITHMDDGHLANTIRMVEPDAGHMQLEDNFIYCGLVKEARRRRLVW